MAGPVYAGGRASERSKQENRRAAIELGTRGDAPLRNRPSDHLLGRQRQIDRNAELCCPAACRQGRGQQRIVAVRRFDIDLGNTAARDGFVERLERFAARFRRYRQVAVKCKLLAVHSRGHKSQQHRRRSHQRYHADAGAMSGRNQVRVADMKGPAPKSHIAKPEVEPAV